MAKFEKGQSGNPAGRKPGTSHAQKLREAIEGDLPDIIDAMTQAAKSGDTSAAKLLLERSIPAYKPTQHSAAVGDLSQQSLTDQGTAIIEAMGHGRISPDQAQAMLAGLASLSKIREIDDLEQRLSRLEKSQ